MSRVDEAMRRAGGPIPVAGGRLREDEELVDLERAMEAYPREHGPAAVPLPFRELGNTAIAAPRTGTPRALGRLAGEVEGKVVVDHTTPAASVEEYRRLAATLHQLQESSGLRTLMVSSALPGDGKTLTSTNLALTLSEAYKRRVLLVDVDLRRPSIHHLFNLPNSRGLADGLRGEASGSLPLIEVSPHLTVLPAGTPDNSPMAGLTSDRLRAVIKEASSRFDWVILDTPPIGLLADANLLAALVDGVLLVIGAGSTDYPVVRRAVAEFGRERIVGVVLNRVHAEPVQYDYYRRYYYPSSR
jgi:capsular exopolysaccharide synthesis family protein